MIPHAYLSLTGTVSEPFAIHSKKAILLTLISLRWKQPELEQAASEFLWEKYLSNDPLKMNDWGICFRQCKACGKYFLAKSQRYELCSDKCRKAQALQNKREFDERARENNYDLLYKNECQNWRNKINRVKNTAGFPADRLEKIQAAFSDFKKEALQRKKAVKTGTASPKEFTDWLYQQSDIILKLTTF